MSGPKKEYGHLGLAGLVQRTRARSTGTEVGLYASLQAGMESDPELPWCTVCEEHNTLVCHRTLALARENAPEPEGWCEECRDHLNVLSAIDGDLEAIAAIEEP
jgi:hypothetical protein